MLGAKHPAALGQPARETWAEAAPVLARILDNVWSGGAMMRRDVPFSIERCGQLEETFFTFSVSPLFDGGAVVGVLCAGVETTQEVRSRRRIQTLSELSSIEVGPELAGEMAAAERAAEALARNPNDVPFALIYLRDESGQQMNLAAAAGVPAGSPIAPHTLSAIGRCAWPVFSALRTRDVQVVDRIATRFPGVAYAPWAEPPRQALVLPTEPGPGGDPAVYLVLGVSPRAPLDGPYRSFLQLVADGVAAVVRSAQERRGARERMAALTELDRTKTEFFANISHEFRTPLTLLLLPLEQLLEQNAGVGRPTREAACLARRNALRLLRLVNTLLQGAEIDQGQLRPHIEAVDHLDRLTSELGAVLAPAIERAGLELIVDCAALETPVALDVQMWETIVLNLLSNALKHTFAGRIELRLRACERHVELQVQDTGIGIPEAEIPQLFERFHRVADAPRRSHEGSGIGLWQVDQLVRLHAGMIRVRSRVGEGSCFTVWIPLHSGRRIHPADPPADNQRARAHINFRRAFAEEAEAWLGDGLTALAEDPDAAPPASVLPQRRRPLLVVEDDPELRAYLHRRLNDRYEVTAVAGGKEALVALAGHAVDLVLTDVVMPELDGIELLSRIRTHPRHHATPVILLTGVADPEAAVGALAAGAHDYIVKPFTIRELTARIDAQLALATLRDGDGDGN